MCKDAKRDFKSFQNFWSLAYFAPKHAKRDFKSFQNFWSLATQGYCVNGNLI
jgi:hypothetical protein